ncbi:MAG: ATP-dependent DNA helicase [Halioglobus sp.]
MTEDLPDPSSQGSQREDTPTLSIAVADLARFCHRTGDIDHRFKPSPTGAQGTAGHQSLYQQRPASYISEYAVEHKHVTKDVSVTLRGRADGYDPEQNILEEIKTCRVEANAIPEAVATLHMAQAKLYAAIIAQQENLPKIRVRVTWLNIDTNQEWDTTQDCSNADLAAFLDETLGFFSSWLETLQTLRMQRDISIIDLDFPYGDFRAGQRQLAEMAYKCIDQAGQLLIEAPTGIGKTAALLYPALKALATKKHDKIIFTTAKTVGRRAAEDTLLHFGEAGFAGRALTLSAKEKICLSPGHACHADDCPYAAGYYDKLAAALKEAIKQPSLRREDLEALAREFEVCPYELSLDLLPWVDIIIGDIHYAYSLSANLGNTMLNDDNRWTVLVDEAHNLPDRARSMYSATLDKSALMQAKKSASGSVKRALNGVNTAMLALQKMDWQEDDFHSSDSLPGSLPRSLEALVGCVGEALAERATYLHQHPPVMDFYFAVLQFMRVADCWADDYRFEMTRGSGKQSLELRLNCLDPARLLRDKQKAAHAVIAFSATLSPLHWSRNRLGLAPDAVQIQAESPFDKNQLEVQLATQIDTRYAYREQSAPTLAHTITQWLTQKPGNCIVYFPSYAYMDTVLSLLQIHGAQWSDRTLWQQQRDGGEHAQQTLLALLEERRDIVAFCILGGIFGEGVDLPGEQLSSVIIVGVGTPQLNRDTRALQQWYEKEHGDGFDYTFIFPGVQKVNQALGRVVRTLTDNGSALLIDSRYTQKRYTNLLPPWWDYKPAE